MSNEERPKEQDPKYIVDYPPKPEDFDPSLIPNKALYHITQDMNMHIQATAHTIIQMLNLAIEGNDLPAVIPTIKKYIQKYQRRSKLVDILNTELTRRIQERHKQV